MHKTFHVRLAAVVAVTIGVALALPAHAGETGCKTQGCISTDRMTGKKPIIPTDKIANKKKVVATKKVVTPAEKPAATDKVATPEAAKP